MPEGSWFDDFSWDPGYDESLAWGDGGGGGGAGPESDPFFFPEFNMPEYGYEAEPAAGESYAGGAADLGQSPNELAAYYAGQGYTYDPSTGQFYDRGGATLQPQGGTATQGGVTPPNTIQGPGAARSGQARYQSPYENPALKTIDESLNSPLGRALAGAGIGASSLLAARLFGGPAPRVPTIPVPPASPLTTSTEGAVNAALTAGGAADLTGAIQSGLAGQRGTAQAFQGATGYLPGLLRPVQPEAINDPIEAAMRAEVLRTLEMGSAPDVDKALAIEEARLRNDLYRRLGPDYELSQPGQEVLQAFKSNATVARYQSKLAALNTIAPQQGGRYQFTQTYPVSRAAVLGGENRANVGTIAGGNYATVPTASWLTRDPNAFRGTEANIAGQNALLPYQTALAERESLMKGIGGIGGTIAGSISRPSISSFLSGAL
jgi:hypothetical protein